ncbi:MAG: protein translocase subunit SecD [Acidobacteriota bacterium]
MNKLRNRTILIVLVTLAGLYLVFLPHDRRPTAKDFTSWSQIKQNLANNIHLGLDLRGGSHLVLQVQTDEAIGKKTDQNVEAAKAKLQEKGWPFDNVERTGVAQITITVPDISKNGDIINELQVADFGQGWAATERGKTIVFSLDPGEQNRMREQATNSALQTIELRVNSYGVTEPTIQRHGSDDKYQILVQMPGVDDPERVKNLLNADSNLEIRLLATGTQQTTANQLNPFPTKEAAEAVAKGIAGGGQYEVLEYIERSSDTISSGKKYLIVEKNPIVTGIDLRDSEARRSAQGSSRYEIVFRLARDGAARFGEATGKHVGDYLAVVLNNQIKSAATIQERITDNGRITGSFTEREAEDLAFTLRSGALPAKAIYLEERTVGPSLGADSIRQGVTASIVGLVAVVLFMLFYYKMSGVNAVVALVLNLLLLLALMTFGAVLTLPGIAGVILTIGMGVDSNVLIFERIRDELRNGKVVSSAVEVGFDKAFLTIIDTHITTIVSAVFLFVFGTGPIRGFAVTLVAGLIVNLFTAVFVSKTIYMWHLNRRVRVETLSI